MANRSGNCIKCGLFRSILDRDHIVPKSRGGSDDPSNIQLLCQNCHFDKSHEERMTYADETRAKLRAAHLGTKMSPETRAKMSLAQRKRSRFPPSEATRAKISQTKIAQHRNGAQPDAFSIDTLPLGED